MFNSKELAAMHTLKAYRPSYRAEYFARLELGEYNVDNPIIQSLVFNGLVRVSKAGAITPDRDKIVAILASYEQPAEYRGRLENGWMAFKKSES
jgi:hypothetical protein